MTILAEELKKIFHFHFTKWLAIFGIRRFRVRGDTFEILGVKTTLFVGIELRKFTRKLT
jgi:hypothetical protein